nr:hypothetical protein [uncultured Lichenicoccus sp.]
MLAAPEPALDLLAGLTQAGSALASMPILWTFGFLDGVSADPALAPAFADWLCDAVRKDSRGWHHLAGLLPPAWHGDEAVAAAIKPAHACNIALSHAASLSGFAAIDAFDSLLTAHGTIDPMFLSVPPEPPGLDFHATRGIFSACLRTMLIWRGAAAEGGGMIDRFRVLLDEIERVRTGEPAALS